MSKHEQFGLNGQPTPNQTRDSVPYTLQIPSYFYAHDEARSTFDVLQMKHDLFDVFMTYILLYEHGTELGNGTEYGLRLYDLLDFLQGILDAVLLTSNQTAR